jgi:hypothetical protein
MMNVAVIDMLEIICTREDSEQSIDSATNEKNNEKSSGQYKNKRNLNSEQMCNLADLVVQNVFFDEHCIDYQWPSSSLGDTEEYNESEVDAIKLYIERYNLIKNKVN